METKCIRNGNKPLKVETKIVSETYFAIAVFLIKEHPGYLRQPGCFFYTKR